MKNGGVSVKSFSPIVFKIAVKGATEMNYRIETKEAFRIIGVSAPLDKEIEWTHRKLVLETAAGFRYDLFIPINRWFFRISDIDLDRRNRNYGGI